MAEDPYVYPGTNVLRNRFNIRDAAELARRETDASAARLLQLRASPLDGGYDLVHLQAFHRQIFGDVYPWAGEIRTVALAKKDLFALPQHICPYLSGVLAELPGEGFLQGLSDEQTIGRLTHYLSEINAVHPFREGNGRTQRAFLGQLARDAGYRIAWERVDWQCNNSASIASMRGESGPMHELLSGIVDPL